MLLLAMIGGFASTGFAQTEADNQEVVKQVTLTDEQKAELDVIYRNILEQKQQLANKYEEFGVITSEKKEKWMARMDEHYEQLKESGYIMSWEKHKHHKHKRKHHKDRE